MQNFLNKINILEFPTYDGVNLEYMCRELDLMLS